MKIAFFGTSIFAKNILEKLIEKFEIVALITQEDKPFGRKKILKTPETKEFILKHNAAISNLDSKLNADFRLDSKLKLNAREIPIFQPKNLVGFSEILRDLEPDFILVVSYGKILPKEIINNFYCINIHGSILPRFRGASPIQHMILNGDRILGISIIKMTSRLDDGDILGISAIENNDFNFTRAVEILSTMSAKLFIKIMQHKIAPLAQNSADSSYCFKINRNDGIIDFMNAEIIARKALAYCEFPQIALASGTKLFGITLNEASSNNKAGEILEINNDYAIIGCLKGSLKIESIQASGKSRIKARDYLNGRRLKCKEILS